MRDLPSESTGLSSSRLASKRRAPGQGQFEDSVSEKMPVRYEIRRYPLEVDASADFRRNSRLSPAVWDDFLESCRSTLVSSFRSASTYQKHRANIFFAVEEVKILKQVACVRGTY